MTYALQQLKKYAIGKATQDLVADVLESGCFQENTTEYYDFFHDTLDINCIGVNCDEDFDDQLTDALMEVLVDMKMEFLNEVIENAVDKASKILMDLDVDGVNA